MIPHATPHDEFLAHTAARYSRLKTRARRNHENLQFALDELRSWLIKRLGGEQGQSRCEYCERWVNLGTLEIDHRIAMARGGSFALSNLAIACKSCNQQKGMLTPKAFTALRALANNPDYFDAVDRADLLGRLQIALRLAITEQRRFKRGSNSVRLAPVSRVREPRT
jgi:5-methylcytosine-specific restriction endonuclease McrA